MTYQDLKEKIRRLNPIQEVVNEFIPLKKNQGTCPKHTDNNPSFTVNPELQIAKCWAGCTAKLPFSNRDGSVDVFGFIQWIFNCNFSEAVERLAKRAGIQIEYLQGKNHKRKTIAVYDYQNEQGKLLFQVVRYYPKTFRQRQPDGKDGWIWNLKGTRRVPYRLPELIKGKDPVFIVEGEKDVDNLRRWGLTATTCPMGAKKWRKEYNRPLVGRKIILIPDNDKEGFEHMEEIGQNLLGKAKRIKWFELPRLEEKEDISDWIEKGGTKERLLELARHVPDFDPLRAVYQREGCYIKRGKGIIANFVIQPKVRVQTDQGEFLKADIIPQQGKYYQDIHLSPESWISKQKFKRALRGLLDLQYRGTDDDIQDIKGILASQDPPVKQGVGTTGLHKIDGEWIYVEKDLAWGKSGEYQDIIYLSDTPYKVSLLKEKPLSSSNLDDILTCLFDFNSVDVVYSLLGFCFACFVKERILCLTGQNPILVCWGEKNSGKSATLREIVRPLFGIKSPIENIGHPTEFGFARIISSSNLAPILFDEHKVGRIIQPQRDRISEMLRSVYNQSRFTRGTPDLGIVEFIYSAPIVIAGEMGISELAIKDRIIETYFSKQKIEGKTKSFNKLTYLSLGSLGKDFLLWTLKLGDKEIRDIWKMQLENIDDQLDFRLRENTAHARLGLALFLSYLTEKGKNLVDLRKVLM